VSIPDSGRKVLVVKLDQGRKYHTGRMRALFFADGEETNARYSISEWWLEPRTRGPGTHAHPEDHIVYVLSGTVTLLIEGERTRGE
jgi:quercetin dioxygenase-like cupin family protein